MKKYLVKRIPICVVLMTILVGCSDRTSQPSGRVANALTATVQAAYGSIARVEDLVWEKFTHKDKQVVLVSVKDALAVHSRPACRKGACPRTSPEARAVRMAALAETKSRILADLQKASSRGAQARVKYMYPHFSLMALEANREAVVSLADMPDVERVFFDKAVPMNISSSVPWTGADEYHDLGYEGAGTGVAVLDTPVRYWNGYFGTCPQPGAPNCSVKAWENFTPDDPMDVANSIAHGTNVAGIVLGMAPDTAILSLNVFWWHSGEGWLAEWSNLTAALDWTAEHAEEFNIVAANQSLGGEHMDSRPCNESPLYDPLRTLWVDYGIMNAIASGNDYQFDWGSEPGCISLAMSTGAQYDTDLKNQMLAAGDVIGFSNLNGFLDLLAPGANITAGGISNYSGTSMATPHVAGAIALLQGFWFDQTGTFEDPYWTHKALKIFALPHHHGGRVFSQMEVTGWDSPPFVLAESFGYYLREVPEGLLPFSPGTYTKTIDVSGEGWNVGGVYLYMEVVHPYPDLVEVTLQAPDGSSVSTFLPGGGANFNAVLGRDYYPAVFEDLSGSPVDGTWTLILEDTGSDFFGYYLDAAIFWTDNSCTPDCPGSSPCGDDLCGGTCGECTGTQECMPDRQCDNCSPSCWGDECGDDGCGGSCGECDNGIFCDGMEGCVNGSCTDGALPCDTSTYPCLSCDEVNQDCILANGTCYIEYECYDDDDTHPDDLCQVCDSSVSTDDWTSLDCDDGNPCTDDSCNPGSGCVNTNNSASCDDGDACTENDVCSGGACAGTALDCDDGNVCTDDSCDTSTGCVYTNNTSTCDDSDACTSDDACIAGQCVGTAKVCEDNDVCTDDGCNPSTGECQFTNNTAQCDDGDACTGNDVCSGGNCAGTALDCDDANVCTDDSCDSAVGCVYTNNNSTCDDGSVCTENDACSGGVCNGTAISCDDGNPCTDDSCDPVTGCSSSNNTALCDDGDPCTGDDVCSGGSCAGTTLDCDDDNPCTDDSCDPATGCVNAPNSASCDDGNPCTDDDACQNGSCSGTELDCSNLNAGCQRGVCNPDTGECEQEPVADGAACDDGDACTNGETCQNGTCAGGEDTCDDASSGCSCGLTSRSSRGFASLALLLLLGFVWVRRTKS